MRISCLSTPLLFFILHSSFGQGNDSLNRLELEKVFGKKLAEHIINWKQEDEPWINLKINLPEDTIEIEYFQQVAHPYLAEYNRKILFKTNKGKTDTLEMRVNSGGKTFINIYKLSTNGENLLILLDRYGIYYLDLNSLKYFEDSEKNKTIGAKYLGRIDGLKYPLKFISAKKSKEEQID